MPETVRSMEGFDLALALRCIGKPLRCLLDRSVDVLIQGNTPSNEHALMLYERLFKRGLAAEGVNKSV